MDLSALSGPLDAEAVRTFRRTHPDPLGPSQNWQKALRAVLFIGVGILGTYLLSAILSVLGDIIAPGVAPWASFAVWALAAAAGVTLAWVAVTRWYLRGVRRYRLAELARVNDWGYEPFPDRALPPGMLFHAGDRTRVYDLVDHIGAHDIQAGAVEYVTNTDESTEKKHRWGYLAFRLSAPLPHIVLDAVGNNGLLGTSNLPADIAGDQRLSLEGDFDRHFRLYCPTGYERDALYLFTPDIMARFIDIGAANAVDVEIIDDWLLIYSRDDLVTLDPRTWNWIDQTTQALSVKLDQWARWRDDRSLPATAAPAATETGPGEDASARPVADAGRRLRMRRYTWAGIAAAALTVVWILWDWFWSRL